MAEIAYTAPTRPDRTKVYTWTNVTEADTFQRLSLDAPAEEITVHVTGTFGGATVSVKGSNTDSDGVTLLRMSGASATATTEDLFSLLDRPLYITPTHSGGSSESVTVRVVVRR